MVSIYKAIAEMEESGKRGVICTIIERRGSAPRSVGSKMLVYPDGSTVGTIGGGEIERRVLQAALEALRTGKARVLDYMLSDPQRGDPGVCGGQLKVFVEPVLPPPTLVVVGGGHVGREVAHLGRWLGFRVVLSDDRAEYCTPQAVPDADEFILCPLEELPQQLEVTPRTYFVLTTRSVDIDVPGLPGLLDSQAAYIGVIGSRRRWATTRGKLLAAGVPESKLALIRSPVGVDIHAETPREIAVSIMAEIIMIRGEKNGTHLEASAGGVNPESEEVM